MEEYFFQALGTQWSITLDGVQDRPDLQAIFDAVTRFENRFSRFKETSEVNQFRSLPAGTYGISDDLALLFAMSDKLRLVTAGAFDPVVADVLEKAGYDAQYSFEPRHISQEMVSTWSIEGTQLTIDEPMHFDFGGIGKGMCIDMIASMLMSMKIEYFLVEGGGDMYGTTKASGDPFRIALEWPGKPDTAYGIAPLLHNGLAVSDSYKRRWKQWHHIINFVTKKPIESVVGAACMASSAFIADCVTSALFLTPRERHGYVYEVFSAEGVVFFENGDIETSAHWKGEFFT